MIKNLDDISVEQPGVMAYTREFRDLLPIRDMYITRPNFGPFDTANNFGLTGIIKRVPVSSPFGFVINASPVYEPSDGRDVSSQSIRTVYFRIVDSSNRTIDLKNTDVCFSVVFTN